MEEKKKKKPNPQKKKKNTQAPADTLLRMSRCQSPVKSHIKACQIRAAKRVNWVSHSPPTVSITWVRSPWARAHARVHTSIQRHPPPPPPLMCFGRKHLTKLSCNYHTQYPRNVKWHRACLCILEEREGAVWRGGRLRAVSTVCVLQMTAMKKRERERRQKKKQRERII